MSESKVNAVCPQCGARVEIPAEWLGQERPCPQCGAWVKFPGPSVPAGPAGSPGSLGPPGTLADGASVAPAGAGNQAIDPYAATLISHPAVPRSPGAGSGAASGRGSEPASPPPGASGPAGTPGAPPPTFSERLEEAARRDRLYSRGPSTGSAGAAGGGGTAVPPPASSASAAAPGSRGPAASGGSAASGGAADSGWSSTDPLAAYGQKGSSAGASRRGGPGESGQTAAAAGGHGLLAYLGLSAGILSLLMAILGCLGILVAGGGFQHGMAQGIAGLFGCVMLVIPVINLAGVVCSGVAVATAPKKSVAWLGVILNGVQLLAALGLVCIGIIANMK